MALAFEQRDRVTLRPHRLTDAAQPLRRRVGVDEVLPGRDDPAGVGTNIGHVGEDHARGGVAELVAQAVDLGAGHHHERGLAGLTPARMKGAVERTKSSWPAYRSAS